ncbi:translin-associated protein X-like isoform X2 [Ylistrum balloti]|uniref:translin-associated protein X-like isoform X2 n=1 Tax=Ylistrum balloti TaxID=509963 RepID=UPI002905A50C|nr:translin-associated protein X-like isoform X2 [Ylistrum balloti]
MADQGKQGVKRSRKGEPKVPVNENSPVIQAFRVYQSELDTRHDKHERLVKVSRDITIDSKRTIFLLQRVAGSDSESALLEEASDKIKQIQKAKFVLIAEELQDEDPYRFIRAYSPGLQEYIEAVSFFKYIKCKELVTLQEIQQDLIFPKHNDSGQTCDQESQMQPEMVDSQECNISPTQSEQKGTIEVHVPPIEYMLGVADLTGELMRLAINSVGAGNLDIPFEVCEFLRKMQSGFQSFSYVSREVKKKLHTLNQSLQKVETACYTLQVRGSEIPKHMLVDVLSSPMSDIHMYTDDQAMDE